MQSDAPPIAPHATPAEFRAKLRWESKETGAHILLVGPFVAGYVTNRMCDGLWNAYGTGIPLTKHDTLAAAQSALVAAVMEMQDGE